MAKLFKSGVRPFISTEEPPIIKAIQEVGALANKLEQMYSVNNNENCKNGSDILKKCEKTIIDCVENRLTASSDNESHYDDGLSQKNMF